jgi:hypothetical protein
MIAPGPLQSWFWALARGGPRARELSPLARPRVSGTEAGEVSQ